MFGGQSSSVKRCMTKMILWVVPHTNLCRRFVGYYGSFRNSSFKAVAKGGSSRSGRRGTGETGGISSRTLRRELRGQSREGNEGNENSAAGAGGGTAPHQLARILWAHQSSLDMKKYVSLLSAFREDAVDTY